MDRIAKLREMLQASPNDSFLRHAMAMEYIKIGDDDAACDLLQALLQQDPGYVGSYYHLGKLMERKGNNDAAMQWYEEGMQQARSAGDQHAYGELRSAFEELTL
jgi:Tfp pilus assembly protein PilF